MPVPLCLTLEVIVCNGRYFSYAMKLANESLRGLGNAADVCHGFWSPVDVSLDCMADFSDVIAWVESDGMVFTYNTSLSTDENGKRAWGFMEFYVGFRPTMVVKYNAVRAISMKRTFGTDGPWDRSLIGEV